MVCASALPCFVTRQYRPPLRRTVAAGVHPVERSTLGACSQPRCGPDHNNAAPFASRHPRGTSQVTPVHTVRRQGSAMRTTGMGRAIAALAALVAVSGCTVQAPDGSGKHRSPVHIDLPGSTPSATHGTADDKSGTTRAETVLWSRG